MPRAEDAESLADLPLDPDLADQAAVTDVPAPPAGRARRGIRPDVLAVIFVGGCAGGFARYATARAAPAGPGSFPWPTLAVNVAGAFILTLVVVYAEDIRPSRYLRPLIGTGFCGGLTTFSAVVVAVARLLAHRHVATAILYLLVTILTALAAGYLGLVAGRAVAAYRRAAQEGSPR